jgi:hypothetical protein
VDHCFIATRTAHMVELTASGDDGAIVQPTFAPNAGDKHMSTRSTAGSGRNKQSPEVRGRATRRRALAAEAAAVAAAGDGDGRA